MRYPVGSAEVLLMGLRCELGDSIQVTRDKSDIALRRRRAGGAAEGRRVVDRRRSSPVTDPPGAVIPA